MPPGGALNFYLQEFTAKMENVALDAQTVLQHNIQIILCTDYQEGKAMTKLNQ